MLTAQIDNSWFDVAFAKTPVMAILRGMGVEKTLQLATTAWDLGIDSVEVPLQNPEDLRAIEAIVARGAERGKSVGAGTIITEEQVHAARDAGASYLVSPGLDAALVWTADAAGLPFLPGVATASEVQAAQVLGLTWVKAFPASWLGEKWFSLMRGPFPEMKFAATGGMNAQNAPSFLAAGASVVAVGSALEDPAQLEKLSTLV